MTTFTDTPKFPLGQIVFRNDSHTLPAEDVTNALRRHERGKWGPVGDYARSQNDAAMKRCGYGEFVLSMHQSRHGQGFFIFTSGDRTETLILLSEDLYTFSMPEVFRLPWANRPMFFDGASHSDESE